MAYYLIKGHLPWVREFEISVKLLKPDKQVKVNLYKRLRLKNQKQYAQQMELVMEDILKDLDLDDMEKIGNPFQEVAEYITKVNSDQVNDVLEFIDQSDKVMKITDQE